MTTIKLANRNNEYQSNTSRWLVVRDGQQIGSVLRVQFALRSWPHDLTSQPKPAIQRAE